MVRVSIHVGRRDSLTDGSAGGHDIAHEGEAAWMLIQLLAVGFLRRN